VQQRPYEQPLPEQLKATAATGHPWKGTPIVGKFHTHPEMAAAGLWTTATDLAKVGVELLKVLNDLNTHTFLTKESITSMLYPQLKSQKIGDSRFVGIGFFCDGKEDSFQFGHAGSNEGFSAIMRFYKNSGKGAVIMVNSNEGWPLISEIIQAISTEYEWPDASLKDKAVVNLENIDNYVGIYLSETENEFKVNNNDGNLSFQYEQQPSLPIFPSSEVVFFSPVVNTTLYFEKDAQGKIISIVVNQSGNQVKANKQAR
jgi:hypothetical protein